MEQVRSELRVSECRACQVVGQPGSTQRRVLAKPDDEERLTAALIEPASLYGSYGQRRLLPWAQAGAAQPVGGHDFVEDRTHDRRKIRVLCVVDEFTRECLGIRVDRKLGSAQVLGNLGRAHARARRARAHPVGQELRVRGPSRPQLDCGGRIQDGLALKVPDNWPHHDVIARPPDQTAQRISVKSRAWKTGRAYVHYNAPQDFDWLTILLLNTAEGTGRAVHVIPRDEADHLARRHKPTSRTADLRYFRTDEVERLF